METLISVKLTIKVSKTLKIIRVYIDPKQTVGSLINQIVTDNKLPEDTHGYHLYGLGHDFLEILPEENCASFYVKRYEELHLQAAICEVITCYYDNTFVKISYPMDATVSSFIPIALKCLNLSQDAALFGITDPKTNSLIPSNMAPSNVVLSLRTFDFSTINYVFSPAMVNIDKDATLITMPSLSQLLISNGFKTLLKLIKKYRKGDDVKLLPLPDDKRLILVLEKLNLGNANINDYSSLLTILFYIISTNTKPYFSTNLQKTLKNFMERRSHAFKLYSIIALIELMPITTNCILLEVCKCFNIVSNVKTRSMISRLLAEIFFTEKEISMEMRTQFFHYILLFQDWIFRLPEKDDKKLFYSGEILAVFDDFSNKYYTVDGELPEDAKRKNFQLKLDPENIMNLSNPCFASTKPNNSEELIRSLNEEISDFGTIASNCFIAAQELIYLLSQ